MADSVAAQINRAMERRGVSRTELAEKLGVGKSYVTQMLSGRNLTLKTLQQVCKALRFRLDIKLVMEKP